MLKRLMEQSVMLHCFVLFIVKEYGYKENWIDMWTGSWQLNGLAFLNCTEY